MKPFASLLLIPLALLSACASVQRDFDPPSVTVSSFRAVPGDSGGLGFEVDLRVVNPNRQTIKLQGVAYTISLEGREVVAGVGKDLPEIAGYSEGTLTLTAAISMFESLKLLGGLMDQPNKTTLTYTVETKLDLGALQRPVRVTDSGLINLQASD